MVSRTSSAETKVLSTFGSRVREAREELGISQEKLAELMNLHRTYVGEIERGLRNVSLVNIARLARALGVDAGTLTSNLELPARPLT